jgi:hypothetical protein
MTLRAVILVVFFVAFAQAQGAENTATVTLDSVDELTILNIAGRIEIRAADPGAARIEWTAHGEADDGLPVLRQTRSGSSAVFRADYGEGKHFVYPSDEYRRLNVEARYDGRKVRLRNDGRGTRAWMDMRIFLEPGQDLVYDLIAGPIIVEGVTGDLELHTRAGRIRSADGQGRVVADTGSGAVEVFGHRGRVIADTGSGAVTVDSVMGDVTADTGSGGVRLRGIDGNIVADTGSGGVELSDVRAERIEIDTGSGGVRLEGVAGSLYVDTGSGSVRGRDFAAGRDLEIDTGSGSVDLAGDLSETRRLRIDTGSGSVDMATRSPPSMRLTVKSNSGGIRVDLPDMATHQAERRRLEATVGAGEGTGVIDTGSGSVTIRRSEVL